MLTYRDVYVTTRDIRRTSLYDLPVTVILICDRVGGWTLWADDELLGSEFDNEKWLRVDVAGSAIVDSQTDSEDDQATEHDRSIVEVSVPEDGVPVPVVSPDPVVLPRAAVCNNWERWTEDE